MKLTPESVGRNKQSLRVFLTSLINGFRSPEEATIDDVLRTSLFLVVALFVVLPVLAVWTPIPLLLLVLIAGASYGAFIYRTDRLFSGAVGAFFVVSIFGANVPLSELYVNARLDVYLVDIVGLVLLTSLVYGSTPDRRQWTDHRFRSVAILGLATFVLWAYLSTLVGNGPSRFAATVFAVEQTRYLLLLVVSALIVCRTDIRFGLYPLMLSIAGNLLYAIIEAFGGRTLGLTYLGDVTGKSLPELEVGVWVLQRGFYAGGYVGHVRQLIALLLLFVPFLVFWLVYGDRVLRALGGLGLAGSVFLVKYGETDAGMMSMLILLSLTGAFCLYTTISTRSRNPLRGVIAAVFGVGATILLHAGRFSGATTSTDIGSPGSSSGSGGSGGGTTGGSSIRTRVVESLGRVPGVKVDTLGIRLTQYFAAVDIAFTYPLFGIGGYNFVLLSEQYGLPEGMGIHNTFLAHLAATGLPGALAYTVSVLAVVGLVIYRIVHSAGQERLFWGCTFAGLVSFHAFSFWVLMYGWQTTNAGFWAFSGIIAGAAAFNRPTVELAPGAWLAELRSSAVDSLRSFCD